MNIIMLPQRPGVNPSTTVQFEAGDTVTVLGRAALVIAAKPGKQTMSVRWLDCGEVETINRLNARPLIIGG